MFSKFVKALNLIQAYLDLLLERKKPKAYPLELSIGTTSFCNLNCIQCPRVENEENLMPKDIRLDLDYYKGLEPLLRRAKEVSLYGLGEPLIDKDYFEKVKYVTSFGAEVSLSTNGTLMDEEKCHKLIDSGIRAIGISLDASSPEVYRQVRPPGGFETVTANIKTLARIKKERGSSRPLLLLSFGIMRQNIQDVISFPDLAKELGAQQLVIHPVTYQSHKQKDELSVEWTDLLQAVHSARQKAQTLGLECYFWEIDPNCYLKSLQYVREWQKNSVSEKLDTVPGCKNPHPTPKSPKKYCSFLWRNAMIQGRGEFFPCCYITNIQLGQLQKQSIFDLRIHPFLAGLKQQFLAGNPPAVCAACPQIQPYSRKTLLTQGWQELRNLLCKAR